MTEEQINHLQSLLDAGTQGEWRQNHTMVKADSPYSCVADTYFMNEVRDAERCRKDASLIVALHNAAPALLEAARENLRLREALEEALGALKCHTGESTLITQQKAEKALGKETV